MYKNTLNKKLFLDYILYRGNNDLTCPICIDNIKNKEKIYITDCKHSFHYDCIYHYINLQNSIYYCPLCRHKHYKIMLNESEIKKNEIKIKEREKEIDRLILDTEIRLKEMVKDFESGNKKKVNNTNSNFNLFKWYKKYF